MSWVTGATRSTLTVVGPARLTKTCSVYVPGDKKIDRADESFGNEASAALMVLNSPEVVAPGRTIIAPEGGPGLIREAA